MNYISYYRVSTDKQGNSGLGLEAQQATVNGHVASTGGNLLQEFTEIASGKNNKRQELEQALMMCELTKSTLLIARLDRLSRDTYFLAKLAKSDVKFVCCDMPNADRLTLHILAGVAEKEARLISERTKQALAEAKKRGVKLGNRTNLHLVRNTDTSIMNAKRTAKSQEYKTKVLKVIKSISGYKELSIRALVKELNDRGVKSPRGSAVNVSTVSRVLNNEK
jgi:DNA invertase Pin-like site-specific DNA recombinase